MRILSLFDGMACGMLAFQRAGIEVERYVAYEIDRFAVQVSGHNFPGIEHRGDVFKADFTEFEGFDFVIGGSPCTYWSIAQRRDTRETEAHGIGWELFQQYVRGVRDARPRYFIYENNKSMAAAIREEISNTFGFEPICINSALVSAQNRQRLYWVGVRQDDGTYRKAEITQPEDRGILLKDILDGGEDLTGSDKSYCLTASYDGAVPWNTIERSQRTMVAEPVAVASRTRDNADGSKGKRFEAGGGKANCLTTVQSDCMVAVPVAKGLVIGGGSRDVGNRRALTSDKGYCLLANPPSDMTPRVIESAPVRVGSMPKVNGDETTCQGSRIYSIEGKGTTLTTKTELVAVPTDSIPGKEVYEVRDGRITIKGRQYPIKLADGLYTIRKLSISECKRLQTVPEEYDMSVISNTQAYKCLGNGWTVEVIAHLIRGAVQ